MTKGVETLAKSTVSSQDPFEDSNDLSDAVLNWYGESIDKLGLYAEAYRGAARSLLETSSSDQLRDIGACPVVFLYRLSLELYLKAILISGSRILRLGGEDFVDIEAILKNGHNLSRLWSEFRRLYHRLSWKWDPDLDSVGHLVQEFQTIDPKASYFRYPVEKDGEAALARDFRFNLRTFSERIEQVLDRLDGIECGLLGVCDEMQTRSLTLTKV